MEETNPILRLQERDTHNTRPNTMTNSNTWKLTCPPFQMINEEKSKTHYIDNPQKWMREGPKMARILEKLQVFRNSYTYDRFSCIMPPKSPNLSIRQYQNNPTNDTFKVAESALIWRKSLWQTGRTSLIRVCRAKVQFSHLSMTVSLYLLYHPFITDHVGRPLNYRAISSVLNHPCLKTTQKSNHK